MSNHVKMSGVIKIGPPFEAGNIPRFATVEFDCIRAREPFVPVIITGIIPTGADWSYEETLTDDLNAIIGMLPPDTLYIGHFECTDEYNDMWRVYIVDGQVVTVRPIITWPEVSGATAA